MENLTFGEYLKKIRVENKISQRDLAAQIGVDFTYLSKIENNKMAPPSEETIKKIAQALNENVDNLILLANKIPSDYKEVLKASEQIPLMLRKISNFSPEQQQKAMDAIIEIEKGS